MDPRVLRDRYELTGVLGRSASSTTWSAQDRAREARCVVKELSVGAVVRNADGGHSLDGDDFTKLVELFEREARVLASLDHPGIPRFIDHFTETVDGDVRLFTVQEHVDGVTVEERVAEGPPFTESEAVEVARRLASILAFLHAHAPPLIHRDVKPSNVMLGPDGSVHLVDFGAVRDAALGEGMDGKTIVGTYGYMPMEQYEARALPQSDVYALGMTLVFLLSRREPTEIPRRGLRLEFGSFVNVSEALKRIIEKAIEPAPDDRFASGGALVEALDRLADPAPGRRRGAATGDLWRGRLRSVDSGVLAVLGLAALAAGLFSILPSSGPLSAGPDPSGSSAAPAPPPLPAAPVRPVGNELTVDIYRDFRYRPVGWPMGRSVAQSVLPGLTRAPVERVRLPDELSGRGVEFGHLPLGNGSDREIVFALARRPGGWALYVDADNDEDLTNDGPPVFNEGSGMLLAAHVSVEVEIVLQSGARRVHPYRLWVWFDQPDGRAGIRGRFYARSHFAGSVEVDGERFDAVAFEFSSHDALLRESGLCIDLDADGECQEDRELFHDGDTVPFTSGGYVLRLAYP